MLGAALGCVEGGPTIWESRAAGIWVPRLGKWPRRRVFPASFSIGSLFHFIPKSPPPDSVASRGARSRPLPGFPRVRVGGGGDGGDLARGVRRVGKCGEYPGRGSMQMRGGCFA